jgi:threonine/homoserine/homoserine lactone efflux protein
MNALIASRSVGSFRRGVITGLGAMSADLLLGVAVYLLQSSIDIESVVRFVYVLGCGIMAYFGYRLLSPPSIAPAAESGGLATYSAALAVGLSNPFQILWWLTAGLAFAYLGGLVLFAGLFGAIAVWILIFPYLIRSGVQRYPRLGRVVTFASGGVMVAFAVYFAWLAL